MADRSGAQLTKWGAASASGKAKPPEAQAKLYKPRHLEIVDNIYNI
jgi:hypothetical protein